MKKLLLILLCFPMIGFGQQTYVPDDNFENYLEVMGLGDGIALNDSVLTGNINTVTTLNIDNLNISDLTGIEAFINDAEQFVATVSDPGPPNSNASLVSNHEELKVLVNLIYEDTKELLEGLTAPDTGERRSSALSSFNSNLGSFQQKIEEIIASSTSS